MNCTDTVTKTDTPIVLLSTAQLTAIVERAVERALAAHGPVADDASRLLDGEELSLRLGCSISKLNRMVRDEHLPHIICGKVRRFRFAEVEQWLAEKTKAA